MRTPRQCRELTLLSFATIAMWTDWRSISSSNYATGNGGHRDQTERREDSAALSKKVGGFLPFQPFRPPPPMFFGNLANTLSL